MPRQTFSSAIRASSKILMYCLLSAILAKTIRRDLDIQCQEFVESYSIRMTLNYTAYCESFLLYIKSYIKYIWLKCKTWHKCLTILLSNLFISFFIKRFCNYRIDLSYLNYFNYLDCVTSSICVSAFLFQNIKKIIKESTTGN